MRKSAFVVAALFLSFGPAQPAAVDDAPRIIRIAAAARPRAVRIGYVQIRAGRAGRLAACADLATARAREARALGASAPAQDHVLDLAFMLCVGGPRSED